MRNNMRVKLDRQVVASLVVVSLLFTPVVSYAGDCPPWNPCQLIKGGETVVNKGKEIVNTGGQVIHNIAQAVPKIADGGLKVLQAGGQALTGHFGEAWKTVQDGGKEMINGTIQVAVSGVVTVATMADPLIGVVFFGQPTPLQGLSKLIYDMV